MPSSAPGRAWPCRTRCPTTSTTLPQRIPDRGPRDAGAVPAKWGSSCPKARRSAWRCTSSTPRAKPAICTTPWPTSADRPAVRDGGGLFPHPDRPRQLQLSSRLAMHKRYLVLADERGPAPCRRTPPPGSCSARSKWSTTQDYDCTRRIADWLAKKPGLALQQRGAAVSGHAHPPGPCFGPGQPGRGLTCGPRRPLPFFCVPFGYRYALMRTGRRI